MDLPVEYGAIIVGNKGSHEAVIKGSPAHKAGIKEGDIIQAYRIEKHERTL